MHVDIFIGLQAEKPSKTHKSKKIIGIIKVHVTT